MGFKNPQTIFQRIMNKELESLINNGCMIYLDDIVIYGKSKEEHDKNLIKVLNILKEKKLKINVMKTQIGKQEIKLLGYIVNGKTIRMPEEKNENLFVFKVPTDKNELQR